MINRHAVIQLYNQGTNTPVSKLVIEVKKLSKLNDRLSKPEKNKRYVNRDGSLNLHVIKATKIQKVKINEKLYDVRVLELHGNISLPRKIPDKNFFIIYFGIRFYR